MYVCIYHANLFYIWMLNQVAQKIDLNHPKLDDSLHHPKMDDILYHPKTDDILESFKIG